MPMYITSNARFSMDGLQEDDFSMRSIYAPILLESVGRVPFRRANYRDNIKQREDVGRCFSVSARPRARRPRGTATTLVVSSGGENNETNSEKCEK